MKSVPRGKHTSNVEVTNVSAHGFWLFIDEREVFLPFKDFPWFHDVSIRDLANVARPHPHHLYWPDLDIDLAVDSIHHPKRYPLVSKVQPKRRMRRTRAAARLRKRA